MHRGVIALLAAALALCYVGAATSTQEPIITGFEGTNLTNVHVLLFDPTVKSPSERRQVHSPFHQYTRAQFEPEKRTIASDNIQFTWVGTWPAAAQTVVSAAGQVLSTLLDLNPAVKIRVQVTWTYLGSNVLGSAASNGITTGDPQYPSNIYVTQAQRNHHTNAYQNSAGPDIRAQFNSGFTWYYGTDGQTPNNQVDMMSVVLHELVHGIAISTGANSTGYQLPSGYMYAFDTLVASSGQNFSSFLATSYTGAQFTAFTTSGNVYFQSASRPGVSFKLFAPNPYQQGSSIAHLDSATYASTDNALMTPSLSYGEYIHHPGGVGLTILRDLKWKIRDCTIYTNCSACALAYCSWCGNTDTNGQCGDPQASPYFNYQCPAGFATACTTCGNGVLDPGETCDDGALNSDTIPDRCRTNCMPASCGDNVKDSGEECDSGTSNAFLDSLCRPNCTLPRCGDGIVDHASPFNETCDTAGNRNNTAPNACRMNCRRPICGDGVVDNGDPYNEQCDNGLANSNTTANACRATCKNPSCGDNVVDNLWGEECDRGFNNSNTIRDGCRLTCRNAYCGDNVIDTGEQCDWGTYNSNTTRNACRLTCFNASCGDGVWDTGEKCDTAGDVSQGCYANCSCTASSTAQPCLCGNGVIDGLEQCDAGILNSDTTANACRTSCRTPTCGDAVTDTGEECDNGYRFNNNNVSNACRTDCKNYFCGDFVLDNGEQCDNGTANNDTVPNGCRTNCRTAYCGDNVTDRGEACDDGANNSNTVNGACNTQCNGHVTTSGGNSDNLFSNMITPGTTFFWVAIGVSGALMCFGVIFIVILVIVLILWSRHQKNSTSYYDS